MNEIGIYYSTGNNIWHVTFLFIDLELCPTDAKVKRNLSYPTELSPEWTLKLENIS
jgi:hypothetical protein